MPGSGLYRRILYVIMCFITYRSGLRRSVREALLTHPSGQSARAEATSNVRHTG